MFNKSKKGGNRHLMLKHNYATIWKKGDVRQFGAKYITGGNPVW